MRQNISKRLINKSLTKNIRTKLVFSRNLIKQFKFLYIIWKIKISCYQTIIFQRRLKQLMHIPVCSLQFNGCFDGFPLSCYYHSITGQKANTCQCQFECKICILKFMNMYVNCKRHLDPPPPPPPPPHSSNSKESLSRLTADVCMR